MTNLCRHDTTIMTGDPDSWIQCAECGRHLTEIDRFVILWRLLNRIEKRLIDTAPEPQPEKG